LHLPDHVSSRRRPLAGGPQTASYAPLYFRETP
jgi:hypothetical protein